MVSGLARRRRTFPHGLVLLGRLPGDRRSGGLRLGLPDEDGLLDGAEAAGDARGALEDRGEVGAHEAQDHVVRDVREVVRRHVRGVEDLSVWSARGRRG